MHDLATEECSRSPESAFNITGIGVHDGPESVFTFQRNRCSQCSGIRIRAERRLGEMLVEQKETVGMNRGSAGAMRGRHASGGAVREPLEDTRPTLAEVGISKKLSSRAQKLAAVPKKEFACRTGSAAKCA